ncbi:hypothetical protein DPMN_121464 [Dreissena polymorpha]|uniref:Uncharacterized protein n=1 Tax=Dreissena polymorpha TaxID=45954 RepID=A0A9D4GLP1_DREPO|nr:hypothetical protein DPMN_121464 [Dreissena polymorpha]
MLVMMAPIVLVVFEGTRRLVSSVARQIMELIPSGNGLPEKYVLLTRSQNGTYTFWEWPSRDKCVHTQPQANISNHRLTITPSNTLLGKTRPLASITSAQETVLTRAAQNELYRFVAGSQSRGLCAFCRPGTGTTIVFGLGL